MGRGCSSGACMIISLSNNGTAYSTIFLDPGTMGIRAKTAGIGEYFTAKCKNCREMFEKIRCCPEKPDSILTPKSRVLYLPQNSIASLTQQSTDNTCDMRMVSAETAARFIRLFADRADMVLKCINKVPFSYRKIVKP